MKQKNKKVQYLLAVLVLVIWGAIAVQFFNFSGGDFDYTQGGASYLPLSEVQSNEAFKFQIGLDYNDPFLGKRRRNNIKQQEATSTPEIFGSNKKTSKRIQGKLSRLRNVKFPKVIYKGYSLNNNQIARVNLSVNKKILSIKKGESKEGVILEAAFRDSIQVSFQGMEKTIFRTK